MVSLGGCVGAVPVPSARSAADSVLNQPLAGDLELREVTRTTGKNPVCGAACVRWRPQRAREAPTAAAALRCGRAAAMDLDAEDKDNLNTSGRPIVKMCVAPRAGRARAPP